MRSLAVVVLLLVSALWAETQQAAYYRAMQAEEAGNLTEALTAFEEAVLIPGPYTEEIQEIINQYKLALDFTDSSEVLVSDRSSSLSFRFLGDLGFYGLHYTESGWVEKISEDGGDLFFTLSSFADYAVGDYIHSLGVSAMTDWFFDNEDMPALDTSDWKLTLGLEYVLVAPTFVLDMGVDFNTAPNESFSPSFYSWLEKDFFKFEKQRVGVALWGYYDTDGPLSFAVYGSWHRSSVYGWNGNVYLGVRLEADSVVDVKRYMADYEAAYNAAYDEMDGFNNEDSFNGGFNNWESSDGWNAPFYMGGYGGYNGYGGFYDNENPWGNNPFNGNPNGWGAFEENLGDSSSTVSIDVPMYKSYGKWIGPSLRSKLSYKFRTKITLEGVMNLYYGVVVAGPDDDYEQLKKFSGVWGATLSWTPSWLTVYLGMEMLYRWYDLPIYYKGIYAKSGFLSEIKTGVKWNF